MIMRKQSKFVKKSKKEDYNVTKEENNLNLNKF